MRPSAELREVLAKTASLQKNVVSVRITIEENRRRGEHMREVLRHARARKESVGG